MKDKKISHRKYIAATSFIAMICLALPAAAAQSWDWQLSAPYDLSRKVDVFDLDPDNVSKADIATLNRRGTTTICYVSIGTLENYRDDVASFPKRVIGKVYGDWPDERFLDIRKVKILIPLMKARFEKCADMGFVSIEADNMDVYENDSGFAISAGDTLRYLKHIAAIAHGLKMKIGQKNVPELTTHLVQSLDFAIAESCYQDKWCDQLTPYIRAGKPVYDAEYDDRSIDFRSACRKMTGSGISMILKDRNLTEKYQSCDEFAARNN